MSILKNLLPQPELKPPYLLFWDGRLTNLTLWGTVVNIFTTYFIFFFFSFLRCFTPLTYTKAFLKLLGN